MTKKVTKLRRWTTEDISLLKALGREKKPAAAVARKLKRSVGATYQQAAMLGVTLGGGRGGKRR
jgi:hypothetical protein